MMRVAAVAATVACAVLGSGCGTLSGRTPASSPSSGSGTATPSPGYNLSGYSSAFKQGYADACATPRQRNAERVKSDADYSMGWNDGQSVCRR